MEPISENQPYLKKEGKNKAIKYVHMRTRAKIRKKETMDWQCYITTFGNIFCFIKLRDTLISYEWIESWLYLLIKSFRAEPLTGHLTNSSLALIWHLLKFPTTSSAHLLCSKH